MDEHLIRQLSPIACQVLLFLMVSQDGQVSEFATTTFPRLSERSLQMACRELESLGLISIVAYSPGKIQGLRLTDKSTTWPQRVPEPPAKAEDTDRLKHIWIQHFPSYPLPTEDAREYLAGRSVEEVEGVIRDAVGHAKSPVMYPRAFVRRALENAKAHTSSLRQSHTGTVQHDQEVIDPITDEVKELARKAREQYAAKLRQQHQAH